MEKQIKFPKGAKYVTVDINEGLLTAVYEDEKLEVGKWYKNNSNMAVGLKLNDKVGCGFRGDEWDDEVYVINSNTWQPANMEEVKKLLIVEAEKRGFKEGVRVVSAHSHHTWTLGFDSGFELMGNGLHFDDVCIFSKATGKWAEIIEEKKPLYTNQYGTEFFEGDYYWHVTKDKFKIIFNECLEDEGLEHDIVQLEEDNRASEILKDREQCLRWIKENIHKLK